MAGGGGEFFVVGADAVVAASTIVRQEGPWGRSTVRSACLSRGRNWCGFSSRLPSLRGPLQVRPGTARERRGKRFSLSLKERNP